MGLGVHVLRIFRLERGRRIWGLIPACVWGMLDRSKWFEGEEGRGFVRRGGVEGFLRGRMGGWWGSSLI